MNEPSSPIDVPSALRPKDPPSWEAVAKHSPMLAENTPAPSDDEYLPLNETLRLYAGWLLAWYGLVYLIGAFQDEKLLPFTIDFIDNLYRSPLTLQFAFGTYLYLLLGTMHRAWGRGILKGLFLGIVGVGLLWAFVMYT